MNIVLKELWCSCKPLTLAVLRRPSAPVIMYRHWVLPSDYWIRGAIFQVRQFAISRFLNKTWRFLLLRENLFWKYYFQCLTYFPSGKQSTQRINTFFLANITCCNMIKHCLASGLLNNKTKFLGSSISKFHDLYETASSLSICTFFKKDKFSYWRMLFRLDSVTFLCSFSLSLKFLSSM